MSILLWIGIYLAMIGEETKWLDELDAKLAKGLLRASADAEELSEELDVSHYIPFSIELKDLLSTVRIFYI